MRIGEIETIKLLNNYNFEETNLTIARLPLISMAEAQTQKEKRNKAIEALKKSLDNTGSAFEDIKNDIISMFSPKDEGGGSTQSSYTLSEKANKSKRLSINSVILVVTKLSRLGPKCS